MSTGPIDYTSLITSEHRGQPKFNETVDLTANGIGDITSLLLSIPGLFDLDTAIGSQLDVDGQWIGFSRAVNGVTLVGFFGFADNPSAVGWGELGNPAIGGRFIELNEEDTSTSMLADPEYRLTLQAKITQNFWDASVAQLEQAMDDLDLTPSGIPPTIDPGTKVVAIFLPASLNATLYAMLTQYDLLPRPAGVRYELFQPLAKPYPWTTAGTAVASGTTVSKPTGVNAWDSSGFIADPSVSMSISFQISSVNFIGMVGLATNPSGSPNYPTLNCAIYFNNGLLEIFTSGTESAAPPILGATGVNYQVYYDKSRFIVVAGGQVVFISGLAPGISVSPMVAIYSVNSGSVIDINVQTGI